ncbi:MAG: polyhydroxyalkanoate synthesis repressor PhaR [Pseudomonadota bacterium]
MASKDQPTIIKKYANRRLYNTGTSTYVTLEDLAQMVKDGEDFVVNDAKSGENITRSVLTQIIFDQEAKEGQNLLPITFLRQLIGFYGDSMQAMVPSYLEHSMNSFAREQDKIREQMTEALGGMGMGVMEEHVRSNMEMFQKAMTMFMPFAAQQSVSKDKEDDGEEPPPEDERDADIGSLRDQIAEMQKKLDRLG